MDDLNLIPLLNQVGSSWNPSSWCHCIKQLDVIAHIFIKWCHYIFVVSARWNMSAIAKTARWSFRDKLLRHVHSLRGMKFQKKIFLRGSVIFKWISLLNSCNWNLYIEGVIFRLSVNLSFIYSLYNLAQYRFINCIHFHWPKTVQPRKGVWWCAEFHLHGVLVDLDLQPWILLERLHLQSLEVAKTVVC